MAIISVNNLSFSYPQVEEKSLCDISFAVERGDFVVLCGKSGSGKTTLLRLLKPELNLKGELSGEIRLCNKNIKELTATESATKIGFIQQNVEYQLVTHSVRSELAFGLENIGLSDWEITCRIAEVAEFFALSHTLDREVATLSGGEKQLLALASICAMHPDIILLDEPCSQLDPVSSEKLRNILKKLRDDFGTTIVISEHRLEELIPFADKVIAIEDGRIVFVGEPAELQSVRDKDGFLYHAMPVQMRLFPKLGISETPTTIGKCADVFAKSAGNITHSVYECKNLNFSENFAIKVKGLFFSYDDSSYVLKDFSLKVRENSIFALMGENGSGKSTALKLMTGLLKSKRGKIEIFGKPFKKLNGFDFAVLPQKCETLFAGPTIYDDLFSALSGIDYSKAEKEDLIKTQSEFFGISDILGRHPYDVSGGEMQRSALAMVMLRQPKLLFLDEPTKGMDNLFRKTFGEKLIELKNSGVTIFMVCHDSEFCAEYADECALLFDGSVVSKNNANSFFAANHFYTTVSSKISRGVFENTVTEGQVEELWAKNH